jgi:hypothetical protein
MPRESELPQALGCDDSCSSLMQRCVGTDERLSNRRGANRRAWTNNPENRMKTCLTAMALLLAAVAASAAPTTYAIDPAHTFPSFAR